MTTEELIREIVSKSCPFHGRRPIIHIPKAGPIGFSTCCPEFHRQIEEYVLVVTRPRLAKVGADS